MPDQKHLVKRGQGWAFILAIPPKLRPYFPSGRDKPRTHIVKGLGTQSLTEARQQRDTLLAKHREEFRDAARGVQLAPERIEAEAVECFTSVLERLEAQSKRRNVSTRAETEALRAELDELLEDILAGRTEDERANLADAIEEMTDFATVAHELAAAQRRSRKLEPGTPDYNLLGQAITRAVLAAYEARLHILRGEAYERPAAFLGRAAIDRRTGQLRTSLPAQTVARPAVGMRFSEAWQAYLRQTQRDPKAALNEHTVQHNESIYRLFQRFVHDAHLASIDRKMASRFLDFVGELSPRWNRLPGAQDMTLEELAKASKDKGQLSNTTLNRYCSALSAVWKWAYKAGEYEGRSPWEGQWRERGEAGWRRFDIPDLTNLFSAPLLRDTPARERIRPRSYSFQNAMMWIPLVALYSGMRSGEICQLQRSDVTSRDGVWFFNVTDEGEHQRLKSQMARRIVPVHSELLQCGFLDYWKHVPDGQLWPALRPAGADGKLNHYFAKRFGAYRDKCGVTGDGKVFHSFRKNIAQALKDARATPAEIAELLGHEKGFTLNVYAPLGLPINVLRELIERVRYDGLKLSHLRAS